MKAPGNMIKKVWPKSQFFIAIAILQKKLTVKIFSKLYVNFQIQRKIKFQFGKLFLALARRCLQLH